MGIKIQPSEFNIIINKKNGQSEGLVFKSVHNNAIGIMLAKFLNNIKLEDIIEIKIFKDNEKIDEITNFKII